MPNWLRAVLAIATAFVTWFAVATIGNFAIRLLLPGYSDVEKAMDFSLAMQLARLVLGAASSIAAGVVCAAVAPRTRWPKYAFAFLLLALFVPVHASLWAKFPIWYHVVFLGSLVPLVLLGTKLFGSRGDAERERPNKSQERTRER
jgi:hypothetical protein